MRGFWLLAIIQMVSITGHLNNSDKLDTLKISDKSARIIHNSTTNKNKNRLPMCQLSDFFVV